MIYECYFAELLTFTETVKTNPIGFVEAELLSFTEVSSNNLKSGGSSETLAFSESNILNKNQSVLGSDTLIFVESSSPRVYVQTFLEMLVFVEDQTLDVNLSQATDVLVFTETVVANKIKTTSDLINFTESNALNKINNLVASDTLSFVEGDSRYKPTKKFVSETITVGSSDIRFKFGSRELTYRKYEFGNIENTNYSRINRKSAGGDLIVGAASENTVTTLSFTIKELSCSDFDDLRKFLHDTVGELIEFRDHENVDWEGVVVTPNNGFNQISRSVYTASLEFQGTRI